MDLLDESSGFYSPYHVRQDNCAKISTVCCLQTSVQTRMVGSTFRSNFSSRSFAKFDSIRTAFVKYDQTFPKLTRFSGVLYPQTKTACDST